MNHTDTRKGLVMDSVTIYLNTKCNLTCDYCYVRKNNSFIDRGRLEKIMRWFVNQNGPEKFINFLGGEPLLSADLLVGIKDFLHRINPGKKISIKDIPTNGIMLNKEMLMCLKEEGIKLSFSLDGVQFRHNKFRIKNKALFDQILRNIELYKEYYGPPAIKCTVHPALAQDLDKRIGELLKRGFRSIHILPVFGLPWSRTQVQSYRDSINKITRSYLELLKTGNRGIQIHPIKKDIERVLHREFFDNLASCRLGSEPVFMPDGRAYACKVVMHYNHPQLVEKFSIGHIDTGVDIKKMETFSKYRLCQDVKTDCRQTTPGSCCRRVCFSYNTRTGKIFSPKDIATMIEIDAVTFLSVNDALKGHRTFEISRE
ncbi:MAG: radical SAM protein [Candidatus Omnitrophica bacterium]|nr:radical SAM protein [Candidatus Omnitrophota bacterium]